MQECKGRLVLKVSKVPWENQAILVPQDLQALQDLEVYPDFLARTEHLVEMVRLDLKAELDLQAREDYLACLAYQDLKAIVVSLVWTVQRVAKVHLAKKEKKELQVLLDPKEPWDLLVQEEKEAVKVLQVQLVFGELMV